VYSTWMTELDQKTEGCSCSQSLPTTSTSWSCRGSAVEISDKLPVQITKIKWWNNNKKQLLGIRHAHALARSHYCYTTPAHMLSLHALQQRISIGVATCLNTFWSKPF
jgi:hypothetical protein